MEFKKWGYGVKRGFRSLLVVAVVIGTAEGAFGAMGTAHAAVTINPGGVAGPVLWMRSDMDAGSMNGESVAAWKDQSASANNAAQTAAASQPTYWNDSAHNINFNPVLDFDRDFLSLGINTLPLGKKARTVAIAAKTDTLSGISYVIAWGTANSVNTAAGMLRNGSKLGLTPMNSSTDRTQTMYSVDNLVNVEFPHEQFLTWTGGESGNDNIARLYSKMKPVEENKPNGFGQIVPKMWNTTDTHGAAIGKVIPEGQAEGYWDGKILDIIVYDRALTDLERQKVSTYLAIKNGYTISPGDTYDASYLDSGENKVWDSVLNGSYTHRITSIGSDSGSGLKQKQAKAQEAGAVVTAALGTAVQETNSANLNEFAADLSFFIFGDNGTDANYTQTIAQTQDVSLKRMERIHKTDTTNWGNQAVTLQLDLAPRNAAQPEQHYLVVSSREDLQNPRFLPLDASGSITLGSDKLADGEFFTFAHVDKTALDARVSLIDGELTAGKLKENDYTPASWSVLVEKQAAAKLQLGNPLASQAQIDQALKALSDAYDGLKLQGVSFDRAVLEKGSSGSSVTVTLDRGVTFGGQVPAGFTVRVGSTDVPLLPSNISVDPQDPTRVRINLPADLDLSNVDTVGVSYDSATGSLQGLNGGTVGSFNEPAHSGFGAALTIAQPDTVTGVVYGGEPAFGGMTEPGTESLDVVVRDAQGQIVAGAGGAAVIDPSTGAWNLASEQSLPPGTYTVEVTAKKNGQVAVKTRTFTVVDKTALQQRRDAIVGEGLKGSAYTPSTWNELQGALDEAAQVLGDKTATQARIDAALNRLNAARSGLTPVPVEPTNPTNPTTPVTPPPSVPIPSSPTPVPAAPNKQIISVDVAAGSEGLTDLTRVELERTTNADGSLSDQVTFTPAKAQEAIGKALAKNDPTARILIPDPTDAIGEVNVNLPQATIALLTRSGVNLEIHNPNGTVVVPASSLEGVAGDLYFRLVPIKQPQQRQQVENRAVTEQVVRELSGNRAATVASRPMTIETNLSSRPVTLVLPLDAAKLPANAAQRADFLRELGVYIEHSDGTKEVVRGEVVTMDAAAGGKLGLRFGIQKFSTFTIVHLAEAAHHDAYIQGYTDGTLRPDQGVIRAEMAAMLSRLGQLQAASGTQASAFSDLRSGYWAGDYVGQVTTAGWMKGYTDGSFKPDGAITREEMASIAFNYLGLKAGSSTGGFPDVRANGWSGGIIAAVQSEGLMSGYPDGTFRPQQALTRAEAVTILNRLFDRGPLHGAEGATWPDVSAAHWAYGDLMEASLDHDYAKRSGGGEDWVAAD
ncbi:MULTISPECIES: S-layer homology domain-containing protein [Saccharibacillus]|uniref:S-layer homology domain-containing protein n=1 Tax=Saccharibacillus TaxID=456492 RepID=UPI0013110ACF|nr:S-layer homology domain-containing protein [Saccharibacillus sp. WB 17]MWJ32961.1 hypothetical protein [Saccharibacillus sp. WB 17]